MHDCAITRDLINISKQLEEQLLSASEMMKNLQPRFVLVGSVPEGSRIGLGNEIDLTIQFMEWESSPPFKIRGDAFHLHKSDCCPNWMDIYFDFEGHFVLDDFMYDVCESVLESIGTIYANGRNPHRLKMREYGEDMDNTCDACNSLNLGEDSSWFLQCPHCVICVSRTKMGVCLQFEWHHEEIEKLVFCSIDLVPVYNVEPEDTKDVIRLVNVSMLGLSHPPGWYNHIKTFLKEDRLVEELWSEGEQVEKVLLKSLGSGNYFIRGGQHLRPEVLCDNDSLLRAYICLKALRTYTKVENLSNFMIKKMLMGSTFVEMASSEHDGNKFLHEIITHEKFKIHFDPYIDFDKMQIKCFV